MPLLEPVFQSLIEKLAEGNQRIRDGSKRLLIQYTTLTSIGAISVTNCILKPLSPKQKTASKPLQSRLLLLYDIYQKYLSTLPVDSMLIYMKNNGAFAHSSGDVRDAAKELTIAIQKQIGMCIIL